jgi:hypothetical protein
VEVDIPRFFSHCTLDIIGLAGFGYDFAALSTTGNALAGAFDTLFGAAQQPGIVDLLALLLPGLRYLVRALRCFGDASAHTLRAADQKEQADRGRDGGHAPYRLAATRRAQG